MNPWVAVIGRGKDGLRDTTQAIVDQLQARELRVVGAIHQPFVDHGVSKGFDVVSLMDGQRVAMARVSRAPDLCDYAFFADAFEAAARWSEASSDVVVFEVGKIEAGGRGHWPAVAAAFEGRPRLLLLQIRPSVLASVALDLPAPVADLTLPAEKAAVDTFCEQVADLAIELSSR